MIATHIPKKPDVPDNFTRLAEYIAAAKEEGEKLRDFWIVGCDAGDGAEDLETALAEIEAVRALKPKIDNKTYHLVVSVRQNEEKRLSVDDLKDIECAFAKALGFADHQRVVGTHVNTDNFHMHVAYNMVNPQTLKMVAPWNDYTALERAARAMEKKYGLYVDLGKADYKDQAKGSQKARAFEAHTWQQSFQNHVLDQRDELVKIVGDASTWQDLHVGLADHGIEVRRRGNGLVLAQADGSQTMKASLLDKAASLPALEKRLGAFEPAGEKAQSAPKQVRPHRQYKARPLTRHPGTNKLLRKFLGVRKSTLVSRAIGNWKQFLMSEAYRDPLAMVLIMAHREMLELVFGESNPRHLPPSPVPAQVRPALDHWRKTKTWARPGTSDWLKDRKLPGYGCKIDEDGNLVIPFRDRDGRIQGLRLLAPDGQTLDIGDLDAGLVHMIDPKGRLGAVAPIIATDYAMAAAIATATEAPVIVVPDKGAIEFTLKYLRQIHPDQETIIAVEGAPIERTAALVREPQAVDPAGAALMGAFEDNALSADDALASLEGLDAATLMPLLTDDRFPAPTIAVPSNATSMEIRAAFAPALKDRALIAWRNTTDWATPGNSVWLKDSGIRGYGIKIAEDGRLAVPLKDAHGRLRDVLFIDGDGRTSKLIDNPDEPPLMHLIDPERRFGKDTIVVAADYASAAAIHRETRLPVAMVGSPERWIEVAEALRTRYPDERLVIALDAGAGEEDEATAQRLRAAMVRPDMPTTTPAPQPPAIDAIAVSRMGAFEDDALSAEDALASVNDLNPMTLAPVSTFGDLAAIGQSECIRQGLARVVDDRAIILWEKARAPAEHESHPWIGKNRTGLDLRLDDKGDLLVPMRDAGGRLWGVHVVSPAGTVSAQLGRGDNPGLFHVVGDRARLRRGAVIVTADYPSAMAIHHATGRAVVWAMDDDALQSVAAALRRQYGEREIVIAATDMAKDNRSLAQAEAAAKAAGGKILRPPLDEDARKKGFTSFGDLSRAGADAAIRTAVQEAVLDGKDQAKNRNHSKATKVPAHFGH